MSQILLISGPPGCGKTTWILSRLQNHRGPRGYLRLDGFAEEDLEQARDGGLDLAFLLDQCPDLLDLADPDRGLAPTGHAALPCPDVLEPGSDPERLGSPQPQHFLV